MKPTINQSSAHSPVFNAMVETSVNNAKRDKNHAQYDDVIRYFSTYIYLSAGRSSYEVLNHNLPLPSTKTVCK